MGSWGSGRWRYHSKATTVEECRVLDLGQLAREGTFLPGRAGAVGWLRGEKVVACVAYYVRSAGVGLILQLSYRCTCAGKAGEDVELPIRLETTSLHFGGHRWWGICPLMVSGQACNRRVAKLYFPPGGRYFGCRHCYRLTYRSVQEHDKRVDALRKN